MDFVSDAPNSTITCVCVGGCVGFIICPVLFFFVQGESAIDNVVLSNVFSAEEAKAMVCARSIERFLLKTIAQRQRCVCVSKCGISNGAVFCFCPTVCKFIVFLLVDSLIG